MILTRATKRNIILFLLAFLLCGFLHVYCYCVDFTVCCNVIFCSILVSLWAITIQKRITDRRLRSIMLWIVVFFLVHFLLQLFKYELFSSDVNAQRYIWYCMYIPMTAQPILCFLLACFIYRKEDEHLPSFYYLTVFIGALLVVGVLTNDLHFWAKSFPSGIMEDNGQEKSEWLYYVINVFIYGLYAVTLGIILKKNRQYVARKYRWIIFIPLAIGVSYFALYPLDIDHMFFHSRVWNMADMTAFCIIAEIETCIQLGMIPANRGYEKLFTAASFPAVIKDESGKLVYSTSNMEYPFKESSDVQIVSFPVSGGSIEYPVDIHQINRLNESIAERARQLQVRNDYIAEENRIKKEKTELQTRNQLYENINSIIRPQLESIEKLLSCDDITDRKLAQAAVLKAYIKRRSNMEFVKAEGILPSLELVSAISESLEYIRLCIVNTASHHSGENSYPAEMIITAYEHFERIVEENIDTLSSIAVTIRSIEDRLTVRIMLTAESFSCSDSLLKKQYEGFLEEVSITREERDTVIVLDYVKGGKEI